MTIHKLVVGARVWAGSVGVARQRQIQPFTVVAHPADLAGRHTYHEGIGLHISVNHSASSNERVLANGCAADNGAVSTQSGPMLDQGIAVLVLTVDCRARVVDISEYHARAAEYITLQRHIIVDRDIILDLDVVAYDNLIANKNILA